jgi:hypothetical protein
MIKGQLYLIFSKFGTISTDQIVERPHFKNHFCLTISNKNQTLELYTLQKETFEEWKTHFEKRCIRIDFHEENEVIK